MAYVFSYSDVLVKPQRGTAVVLNSFVPYNFATDVSHFKRKQFFTNTEVLTYQTRGFGTYTPATPVVQSSDIFISQDTFPVGWPEFPPPFIQQWQGTVNHWTVTFVYNEATDVRRARQASFRFVDPGVYIKRQNSIPLSFITPAGPALTTVPDEVGVPEANAVTDFAIFGLVMIVVGSQYDDVNPLGTVSSQQPIGGSIALVGSQVQVYLSLGPTPVPPFPGVTLPDAIYIAINSGLVVGQPIRWQYDPVIPYNYVISQDPPAGSNQPLQTTVYFVASLGPAPDTTLGVLPDLTNMMVLDAQQAVTDAGGSNGKIIWQYSTTVPGQYVISQSVPAGTTLPVGTVVVLTVSAGTPVTTLPGAQIVIPTMH